MASDSSSNIQGNKKERRNSARTLHNNKLPVVVNDNRREWYNNGLLHRDNDLPAVIDRGKKVKMWYQNGVLHRSNGLPAVVTDNSKQWYKFGVLHRDMDLPAVISMNYEDETVHKKWYKDGKLYREQQHPFEEQLNSSDLYREQRRFFQASNFNRSAQNSANETVYIPERCNINGVTFLVYCTGKCGTKTLINSCSKLSRTYWTHGFNLPFNSNDKKNREHLLSLLTDNEPVIVIDSFRDPIARKISSYFQNLRSYIKNINFSPSIVREDDLKKLAKDFHSRFLEIDNYTSSLEWKQYAGYDIMSKPFDFEANIQLHTSKNKTFINLRFKDITNWETILKNTGIEQFKEIKLINGNESSKTWYSKLYSAFKSKFKLSQHEFDTIKAQYMNLMEHFWTPEEIQEWIDKYTELIE